MVPSFIIVLIVISLLIFVHELGHFLAAKKAGIKVEEFGFGYPPRLLGKKIGETIYSINLIPFGGFVRLLGQELSERKKLDKNQAKKAFFSKSKKKRALVLLAGIIGNLLLGILAFSIIYTKLGIPQKTGQIKIIEVAENSPAKESGLKSNDIILSLDGEKVNRVDKFIFLLEEKEVKESESGNEVLTNEEVVIETEKDFYVLKPRSNPPEGKGRLGVIVSDTENVFYPWWKMPFLAAFHGTKEALVWSLMILQGIFIMFGQLFSGITPQVAGPVGIIQLTSQAAQRGILDLIQFTGILSINLAVLNLLPFPALDGGHLVFLFLSRIIKEEKREKIEQKINLVGFILLLGLMVLVTIGDFSRIFKEFTPFTFLKGVFKVK